MESKTNNWQKARFDEAMFKIINEVDQLGDRGHRNCVYEALFDALISRLEDIGDRPIITTHKDGFKEWDENTYWIIYTIRSIYQMSQNLNIMYALSDSVTGKNSSTNSWIQEKLESASKEVEKYENERYL